MPLFRQPPFNTQVVRRPPKSEPPPPPPPALTGSATLSGGGVIAATRVKGAVRTQTLTGGGVITRTAAKGAQYAAVGGVANNYRATVTGTNGPDVRTAASATPPTIENASGSWTNGVVLQANVGGSISYVRYWHGSPCLAGSSHVLSVYDVVTGVRLGSVTDAHPDGTGDGWRELALTATVPIRAGQQVRASYTVIVGQRNGRTYGVVPTSLTSDLTIVSNCWGGGDTNPYSYTADYMHVDVAFHSTNGLVGYWRLGESSGTAAADEVGGNTGSYVGSPTLGAAGAIADLTTAVTINGTSQYIDVPDSSSVRVGDVFTAEAWVKFATLSGVGILFGGGGGSIYFGHIGDTIFIGKQGVAVMGQTGALLSTGVWHHLVWAKDGATSKVYLDGVDVTPSYGNHTLTNSGTALQIGTAGGIDLIDGTLDEAALYNVAVSAGDVAAHFAAATALVPVSGSMGTGGGVITSTGVKLIPELHSGSASLTGGGVLVAATRRGAVRTQVITGGGVLTRTSVADRRTQAAFTGGGVTAITRSASRRSTVTATGGGVIASTRRKTSLSTATFVGGGSVVSGQATTRSLATALSGGGRVLYAFTAVEHRSGFALLTGGGVAGPGQTTDRVAISAPGINPLPLAGSVAQDTFTRSATDSWGTANTGGSWTVNTPAPFDVNGSRGLMTAAANNTRRAWLASVSALDTDAIATVQTDKIPAGAAIEMSVALRQSNIDNDMVVATLGAPVGGRPTLSLLKRVGGTQTVEQAAVTLDGAHGHDEGDYALATDYKIRFRATGTNPTTIEARAWKASNSEPTHWCRTSSVTTAESAAIQAAGAVGLRVFNGAASTAGTITFSWDNLLAEDFTAESVLPLTGGGVVVATPTSARSAAGALTGGGVIVATGVKQEIVVKTGTATLTGGGVIASVGQRAAIRDASLPLTGGGVILYTRAKGTSAAASLSGGGVATVAQASTRSRTQQHTGGGVATVARSSVRSASQALTGGGAVVGAITTNRRPVAVLTGSGVLVATPSSSRIRTQGLTGGGVLVAATRKGAASTAAFTGGGIIVPARTASRQALSSLTGGGVLVFAQQTARSREEDLTGGGRILYAYSFGETRSGFAQLTGGGTVALAVTSARRSYPPLAIDAVGTEQEFIVEGNVDAPSGPHTVAVRGHPYADGTYTATAFYAPGLDQTIIATTGGVPDGSGVGGGWIYGPGVPAATGAGVIVEAETAGRYAQIAATGGGVILAVPALARQAAYALTGGGIVSPAQQTARSEVVVATGGGTVTYAFAAGANVSGFASLTGGGVATVTQRSARSSPAIGTGGGVIATTPAASRLSGQVLTGGGVLVALRAVSRRQQASLAGGGLTTITTKAGRSYTAAATGGGAALPSWTGAHRMVASLTGGGRVFASSAAQANATGFALLTGGGVLAVTQRGGRRATAQSTGGGVLAASSRRGARASVAMTGGGTIQSTFSVTTSITGSVHATGGGTIAVNATRNGRAVSTLTGGGVVAPVARRGAFATAVITGGGVLTHGYRIGDAAYAASLTGGGVVTITGYAWRRPMTANTGSGPSTVGTTVVGGLRATSAVGGIAGSSTSKSGLRATTNDKGLKAA